MDPITFRSVEMEADFYSAKVSPMLRTVVLNAAEWAMSKYGWLFAGTSLLRTAAEDKALKGSGVHVDGRGFDIRTRGVPQAEVDALEKYVNDRWQYDPQRPSLRVLIVKPHGTGPHGHFQVHARTRRRPE